MTDIKDLDKPFKALDLNRNERLQIMTLCSIGWSLDKSQKNRRNMASDSVYLSNGSSDACP